MSRLVRIPASAEFRCRHHRFRRTIAWWLRQERAPRSPLATAISSGSRNMFQAKCSPSSSSSTPSSIRSCRPAAKAPLMAGIPVMMVAQAIFLVCLILVPLFVWYVREKGDAWVINAVVSTVAFPFWAYALGATAFAEHWDGNLAAITLATFTVVSGLIAPRSTMPERGNGRLPRHRAPSVAAARPGRPGPGVVSSPPVIPGRTDSACPNDAVGSRAILASRCFDASTTDGERSDDPYLRFRAGRPHRPSRGRGGAAGRALRLRRRRRVLSLRRPSARRHWSSASSRSWPH